MISIRAPLAGSDATASATVPPSALFQSALPLRGATQAVAGSGVPDKISIRAPLAGSDNCEFYNITGNPDFNPRSPYGERPVLSSSNISISGIFQSALPLRGATPYGHTIIQHATISIRAPLAGSDIRLRVVNNSSRIISIRAPLAGSDLNLCVVIACLSPISIRAPLAGSDFGSDKQHLTNSRFQSALPLRGATATFCSVNLLSAKCCIFKDRRRKFSRQTPQNNSKKRHNEVRSSLVEHERL